MNKKRLKPINSKNNSSNLYDKPSDNYLFNNNSNNNKISSSSIKKDTHKNISVNKTNKVSNYSVSQKNNKNTKFSNKKIENKKNSINFE